MSRRILLVTPCRDEARYIRATLETVAAQTLPPTTWIVVDDGSTDETPQILAQFSARYPFIRVLRREDRGGRAVGPGVIEAFYAGLAQARLEDFDYVCKLDGDLELPPRYFETLVERMEAEPHLGNLSGKIYEHASDGALVYMRTGDENAVGAAKFYRTACFRDIGGFVREVMWDGIDGHLCRMKGWIACSVDDPALRLVHLRPMGSSQVSLWEGRKRWGRGKYFMGSAWYYVLAASLYRLWERPWIVGGIGIALGYARAALSGHPRYEDPEYRRFLRRFERQSLVRGRSRTLARYDAVIRARYGARTGTGGGA